MSRNSWRNKNPSFVSFKRVSVPSRSNLFQNAMSVEDRAERHALEQAHLIMTEVNGLARGFYESVFPSEAVGPMQFVGSGQVDTNAFYNELMAQVLLLNGNEEGLHQLRSSSGDKNLPRHNFTHDLMLAAAESENPEQTFQSEINVLINHGKQPLAEFFDAIRQCGKYIKQVREFNYLQKRKGFGDGVRRNYLKANFVNIQAQVSRLTNTIVNIHFAKPDQKGIFVEKPALSPLSTIGSALNTSERRFATEWHKATGGRVAASFLVETSSLGKISYLEQDPVQRELAAQTQDLISRNQVGDASKQLLESFAKDIFSDLKIDKKQGNQQLYKRYSKSLGTLAGLWNEMRKMSSNPAQIEAVQAKVRSTLNDIAQVVAKMDKKSGAQFQAKFIQSNYSNRVLGHIGRLMAQLPDKTLEEFIAEDPGKLYGKACNRKDRGLMQQLVDLSHDEPHLKPQDRERLQKLRGETVAHEMSIGEKVKAAVSAAKEAVVDYKGRAEEFAEIAKIEIKYCDRNELMADGKEFVKKYAVQLCTETMCEKFDAIGAAQDFFDRVEADLETMADAKDAVDEFGQSALSVSNAAYELFGPNKGVACRSLISSLGDLADNADAALTALTEVTAIFGVGFPPLEIVTLALLTASLSEKVGTYGIDLIDQFLKEMDIDALIEKRQKNEAQIEALNEKIHDCHHKEVHYRELARALRGETQGYEVLSQSDLDSLPPDTGLSKFMAAFIQLKTGQMPGVGSDELGVLIEQNMVAEFVEWYDNADNSPLQIARDQVSEAQVNAKEARDTNKRFLKVINYCIKAVSPKASLRATLGQQKKMSENYIRQIDIEKQYALENVDVNETIETENGAKYSCDEYLLHLDKLKQEQISNIAVLETELQRVDTTLSKAVDEFVYRMIPYSDIPKNLVDQMKAAGSGRELLEIAQQACEGAQGRLNDNIEDCDGQVLDAKMNLESARKLEKLFLHNVHDRLSGAGSKQEPVLSLRAMIARSFSTKQMQASLLETEYLAEMAELVDENAATQHKVEELHVKLEGLKTQLEVDQQRLVGFFTGGNDENDEESSGFALADTLQSKAKATIAGPQSEPAAIASSHKAKNRFKLRVQQLKLHWDQRQTQLRASNSIIADARSSYGANIRGSVIDNEALCHRIDTLITKYTSELEPPLGEGLFDQAVLLDLHLQAQNLIIKHCLYDTQGRLKNSEDQQESIVDFMSVSGEIDQLLINNLNFDEAVKQAKVSVAYVVTEAINRKESVQAQRDVFNPNMVSYDMQINFSQLVSDINYARQVYDLITGA